MQVSTNLVLDLQRPNINAIAHAKQNDKASRSIVAKLMNGESAFMPPNGANYMIRYGKSDGTGGMYDKIEDGETAAVTVSQNTATIRLAEQALTAPGPVVMELNIYDSTGAKLTTFSWIVFVEESAFSDEEIVSTNYFNILTEEIALAVQAGNVAQQALDTVPEAAQTATQALADIQALAATIVGNVGIDDAATRTTTTWSSQKIDGELGELRDDLTEIQGRTGIEKTDAVQMILSKRFSESGTIINSSNVFGISGFFEITTGMVVHGVNDYPAVSMPSVVWFDSNKEFIGYTYKDDEINISEEAPTNAEYFRLSSYADAEHPFENISYSIKKSGVLATKTELNEAVSALEEKVTTSKNEQFKDLLYGYRTSENGKYLSNGNLINNQNWCSLVDYVPVEGGKTYALARKYKDGMAFQSAEVTFYTNDKTFISENNFTYNNAITTPANCAYVRFSITNTNYNPLGDDDFNSTYMAEAPDGNSVHTIDTENVMQNAYPLTTLFGKKWSLFGDSITEKNVRSNINYHDYIRSELNVITNNNALGGSGYKNRDDNNNAFYQIALKTVSNWSDSDIITIMGGVNDHWSQIDVRGLGDPDDVFVEPSDITGATSNTVMACFNKTLDVIIANAPNTRIGVISPLPCYHNNGAKLYAEVPYDEDCNMSQFVVACKKSCALRGIPYLDLFHNSGLRPWESDFNTKYFRCISADSPDGLHPNEYGHKWFYPMVREFLKTLV